MSATGQTGKVVSTCHWGNLLVWEEGHIQLEVTRKDGSTCHDGQINFLVAQEGELITIGKYIIWEFKFEFPAIDRDTYITLW